jgi:hypothetical protein
MAFGMMASGKPAMKGKPSQTKGGKNAISMKGNNEKMPGAKQAELYTKKAAPSDAPMRAVKALPGKSKGKVPVPFMKKGAK